MVNSLSQGICKKIILTFVVIFILFGIADAQDIIMIEKTTVSTEAGKKEPPQKLSDDEMNLLLRKYTHFYFHDCKYDYSGGYLDDVLKIMQKYPSLQIEIQGYTCCGKLPNNGEERSLSLRRAEEIRDYFVQNGIASYRMTCSGLNSNRPRPLINPEIDREKECKRFNNQIIEVLFIKK
jgi:hypothetical protein